MIANAQTKAPIAESVSGGITRHASAIKPAPPLFRQLSDDDVQIVSREVARISSTSLEQARRACLRSSPADHGH